MATLTTRFNEMLNRLEAASLYEAAVQKARQPDKGGISPVPADIPSSEGTSDFAGGPIGGQILEEIGTKAAGLPQDPGFVKVLHSLDADQLIQGIVLSEVLGKPLSQRRGHRR